MSKIRAIMEAIVGLEFGADDLAAARALAAERLGNASSDVEQVSVLLHALAAVRGVAPSAVFTLVGRRLVAPVLVEFPAMAKDQPTAMSVILSVSRSLPKALGALMSIVDEPVLDVELLEPDTLRLRFTGPPELASLMEGLGIGLSEYFGERVTAVHGAPPNGAPNERTLELRISAERRGTGDRRKESVNRRAPRNESLPG
jgi:hypothetical protein